MILPILTTPNPSLLQKAAPIQEITPEIRKLAQDMRETMHNAQGLGLAAPQIGQSIALCTIELRDEDTAEAIPFMTLVNPRISWKSSRMVNYVEGCLSIPGWEGPVNRPDKVRVKALDLDHNEVIIEADGLLARILQHEIDHLQGVLFTSYLSKKKLQPRPSPAYPTIP